MKRRISEKTSPSPKEPTIWETFNKAMKARSSWPDKDEFLDVIYWMRQILGFLIGIVWGLFPLKGIVGIILFFIVNTALVYLYFNSFQKVDDEEFGGITELLKEGLMTAFASFMVAWIMVYSAIHYD